MDIGIKKLIRLIIEDINRDMISEMPRDYDVEMLTYDKIPSEVLKRFKRNITISAAFIKKDGSIRHMAFRKKLNAYVKSTAPKTDLQANVLQNNNLLQVYDTNVYIKAKKEGKTHDQAVNGCYRRITLDNVLGFLVGGKFYDTRDINKIRERYGEKLYNGLTKGMQGVILKNIDDVDKGLESEGILKESRGNRGKLFEDLFLKKDMKNGRLVIFSDRKGSGETYKLGPKFKDLGFVFNPEIGYWVGGLDKKDKINDLIKKHNTIKGIIEELEDIEDFIEDSDIIKSAKSKIMDNLELYVNDLANATDAASMSAEINNYLAFFSKFHKYSLTNTWLIFLQKRDATDVASYNKWKELGRGVKKGAKAISIWYPMGVKSKQDMSTTDDNEDINSPTFVTRFGMGSVFDISDTYAIKKGGEIPETPKWFDDNTPSYLADKLSDRFIKFAESIGIKITKEDSKGGEKGYSAGGHINLTSSVSGVGQASTLVHELAHELLHWKKSSPFYSDDPETNTRAIKELQAESVSYIVMKHYDLPVTHHPTYLALWKANKEKIMKNLKVITSCAKYIINGVEDIE